MKRIMDSSVFFNAPSLGYFNSSFLYKENIQIHWLDPLETIEVNTYFVKFHSSAKMLQRISRNSDGFDFDFANAWYACTLYNVHTTYIHNTHT